MKCIASGILLLHATIINACHKPACTTVHIQNLEGPIYVSSSDNCLSTLGNQASTSDHCYPTLTNLAPTCDNRYPTLTNLATTCDNRYPTLTNLATTCDNSYPTLSSLAPTCDSRYPTLSNLAPTSDTSQQISHSSTIPYHQTICETDCKCVTKHQVAAVPVNSVQQNVCTPVYYCSQYPEGYGYVNPEVKTYSSEADVSSCPRISETLIPLLKTYLTQNSQSTGNCPTHCCQCGHKHSQYYS